MSRTNYAKQKLSGAVYELAIGEGDIRDRLLSIRKVFFVVFPNDFPPETKIKWEEIIKEVTKDEPIRDVRNGNIQVDSIAVTVGKMRRKKASLIAKRILDIYYSLP